MERPVIRSVNLIEGEIYLNKNEMSFIERKCERPISKLSNELLVRRYIKAENLLIGNTKELNLTKYVLYLEDQLSRKIEPIAIYTPEQEEMLDKSYPQEQMEYGGVEFTNYNGDGDIPPF